MRLAYLVNQYPKTSHTFIRREIAALESLGHDVLRVTIRRPPEPLVEEADRVEAERTRVLLEAGGWTGAATLAGAMLQAPARAVRSLRLADRHGRRSLRGRARHAAYWAEAALLRRWCARQRIEHVHAHFGSNPASVALLARELGGPPFSFTAHGVESFDAPPLVALGDKVARAQFTVAVSSFGRSQLQRWSEPAHWQRIHVIRCGLDRTTLDRPPAPPCAEARLVCVARLASEKGLSILLHAAARLRSMGLRFDLDLVGDGPMRAALVELADGLGLASSVHFLGWKTGSAVRECLERSRALVLPSLAEGLPVVIVEAMAMGRAVVATSVGGIPELVETGVTGWLCAASSVTELAAALAEALRAAPERLNALGAAGRSRVREFHDLERETARLAALFAAGSA
jgi:glycosyltransferase involved in cell wall biosynthesis